MNPDLDALATRLYVTIDDLLIDHPDWRPERPAVGIAPKLTDAELVTLAVIQALLGFTSEARFIRHANTHLRTLFPYLPQRPAYNKRLRHAAATMQHIIEILARDCPSWHDDLWLVDSTPVECGRSRETVKRSDMAGWATYGYCASHSRFFWGLRLHLIATPSGLPVAYALTGAKTDERDTALAMIHLDPALDHRPGQVLMADKGYRSATFEAELNARGITLIRPAIRSEQTPRPLTKFLRSCRRSPRWSRACPPSACPRGNGEPAGQRRRVTIRPAEALTLNCAIALVGHTRQPLRPFRQIIESVNQTLKAQLDLERHGGRKPEGVCARILQRLLALTAAIWHNETSNHPGPARSLLAYDH